LNKFVNKTKPNLSLYSTYYAEACNELAVPSIISVEYEECVKAWQRRLEKCIRAQGDYFEVDML